MNGQTFMALLGRDVRVARRNFVRVVVLNLLQPMLFVFVFGQIMTRSGLMADSYKSLLLPGIIAISMVMSGIQAVAMPLIAEFQFTREIEDRLLAPINVRWLAVEKVVAGMVQAMVAGLVVIPTGWLMMSPGVDLSFRTPISFLLIALLVALFSSAGGLLLGCSVGQTEIGLMFSLVLAPLISFGCAYYPWSALKSFPILQKVVLLNPLVYASEGLRGSLVPQFPHLPVAVAMGALALIDLLILALGLIQFQKKAVS
ncbi:MAG TPA: ABC transporter permease [Terriglobia bacterium]|nr:ABC transporter permease [Terriglobia bacterium]